MIQYNYTFDPETRTLTPSGDPVNVKNDTNVVQIIFTMPASYEGLALSSYVWRVFYKIAMNTKLEEVRFHQFTDPTTEGENLVLTWTVTNSVTEFAGHLGFALSGTLTDTGGNVTNRINSIPAYERIEPTIGGGSYTEDDAEMEGIKDFLVGIQEAAEAAQAAAETAAAEAEASAARAEQIAEELEPYKSLAIVESASGNPATFTDGSNGIAMKSVSVGIEPVQDLHGYEYSWVGGVGKNKLPLVLADIKAANTRGTWSGNSCTLNGVVVTVMFDADGNITGFSATRTGQSSSNCDFIIPIGIDVDGMAVNGCPSGGSESTYCIVTGTSSSRSALDYGSGSTINGATDRAILRIVSGYNANNVIFRPMIRLSTVTDATFVPYSNICPISGWDSVKVYRGANQTTYDTYSISITSAGTVYGGTLDVTTGELVVDRKRITVGGVDWVYRTTGSYSPYFYTAVNDVKFEGSPDTYKYTILSDSYRTVQRNGLSNTGLICCDGNQTEIIQIQVKDERYSNVTDFKTSMADSKIVYLLKNPLTYTLTPSQITSLLGTNHVWADCGEISCEYVADTKLYIDKIVASL